MSDWQGNGATPTDAEHDDLECYEFKTGHGNDAFIVSDADSFFDAMNTEAHIVVEPNEKGQTAMLDVAECI